MIELANPNANTPGNPAPAAPIDFARDFIPEHLAPLSFTPAWRRLSHAQRRRYNQLQALYFNEQIAFFETMIGDGVMRALARERWPGDFGARLAAFWADEVRHSAMFRALNRRCAPHLYGERDFHFVRVAPVWRAILGWATRRPRLFPLFIWLMLLQEERSLHFSREFIRDKSRIEPHFLATYRAHLIDEAGHVRCDEELLDQWWPRIGGAVRRVNAKLLGWMLGEFFSAPKRAQVRVIDELVREFPELEAHEEEMKRGLAALAGDESYQLTLYSRGIAPRSFARFDRFPEFRVLERAMRGYRFREAA